MPIVNNRIGSTQVVASARVARRFPLTVTQGTISIPSLALIQINTLPNCVFYVLLDAGGPPPPGVTFQPFFAVDNLNNNPRLLPVTVPQLLVPGVPLVLSIRLIANVISGVISVPGGGADALVQIILSASQ